MHKKIYLAGGCFWGVEAYFKRISGVVNTQVGYANGTIENPTYEEVCKGYTKYVETVMVEYDSDIISLNKILKHFFRIVDPTTLNKQAFDIGTQYRSGIYFEDEVDYDVVADFLKEEQKKYQRKIVTENEKLKNFYPAEEYHQDYLDKHPSGYCHINLSKAYDEID